MELVALLALVLGEQRSAVGVGAERLPDEAHELALAVLRVDGVGPERLLQHRPVRGGGEAEVGQLFRAAAGDARGRRGGVRRRCRASGRTERASRGGEFDAGAGTASAPDGTSIGRSATAGASLATAPARSWTSSTSGCGISVAADEGSAAVSGVCVSDRFSCAGAGSSTGRAASVAAAALSSAAGSSTVLIGAEGGATDGGLLGRGEELLDDFELAALEHLRV